MSAEERPQDKRPQDSSAASSEPALGAQPARRPWWLLLLPAAFLFHIAEEVWAGEGFVAWTGRVFSTPISVARFFTINAIGWPLFACLTLVAILKSRSAWLAATLSTMLLVNAGLHALGTLATSAYSPGLATSLLLYPPVCFAALRYSSKLAPPGTFGLGVVAGVFLHGLVLFAAFG